MAKEKQRLKMGWFGWTFLSVIVVTIIGSALFFFTVLDLNAGAIFGGDDAADTVEEPSDETLEKVEEVQDTVGKEHSDIGQFVAEMHEFYNETTGYGAIESLDWENQRAKAEEILNMLEKQIPAVENKPLKADLERIRGLANAAIENKDKADIKLLHRMFHDLDIALNEYKAYDQIWNVTETLKVAE
ncbi:hypothetical protein ACFO3D_12315 [Virgibacillus kekensis]|uniref:Uncharacterized protein n=1 Tax=Virgibacillus kekensis TaxID=202261 RepID=A0ABV9DK42_9BACI